MAPERPTEYEELIDKATRVDQLLRDVERWLHVRERLAATSGARGPEQVWRRKRLAVARHAQALSTALLRDVEL